MKKVESILLLCLCAVLGLILTVVLNCGVKELEQRGILPLDILKRKKKQKEDAICTKQGICESNLDVNYLNEIKLRLTELAEAYKNIYNTDKIEFTLDETRECSYTQQKKDIFLCIRDAKNSLYDLNTLMHVAIHELAHVICKEYDIHSQHGEEWNTIFEELVELAKNRRLYDPKLRVDPEYCLDVSS